MLPTRRIAGAAAVCAALFATAHISFARGKQAIPGNVDPRAPQAFEREVSFDLPANNGMHVNPDIALPGGVITVIQHISMQCVMPQGQDLVARVQFGPPDDGGAVQVAIPVVKSAGTFFGGSSVNVGSVDPHIYAVGQALHFDIIREKTQGKGTGFISVTGYTTAMTGGG